ncbi:MAG: hypothetical protein N2171_08180 [Clostridia bacterium]|nr:hypothetical protein [Clostridia bacterium]
MITIIKLAKWLYISPLTILLFALCFITRKLEVLFITYLIMLLHELAHLCAALLIGLMPSYIAIYPFGVNLRLKNKIVYSLADEIIVYLSGPFLNIMLALAATIANAKLENIWLSDFITKNLALFLINMLPIVPLDGGTIIKKILMHKIGFKRAQTVMKSISAILAACMAALAAALIYQSKFNFSIVFLCVFLIANIFTQKEKYNMDFINELMFYKEKCINYKNKKIKFILAKKDDNIRKLAENFTRSSFFIIFLLDNDGKVDDILTENELMDIVVQKGAGATVRNLDRIAE